MLPPRTSGPPQRRVVAFLFWASPNERMCGLSSPRMMSVTFNDRDLAYNFDELDLGAPVPGDRAPGNRQKPSCLESGERACGPTAPRLPGAAFPDRHPDAQQAGQVTGIGELLFSGQVRLTVRSRGRLGQPQVLQLSSGLFRGIIMPRPQPGCRKPAEYAEHHR